jgi:hypothetical protein
MMARASALKICRSLFAADHDPRTPLETSLRLAAVGAAAKGAVALGAHFIWVRSPRHGERKRPSAFSVSHLLRQVLGGLWVEAIRAIFESKFMLPWSFSEEAAASAPSARNPAR